MTAFALLPPVPKPPHDPTAMVLSGKTGWRGASWTDTAVAGDGSLTLQKTDPGPGGAGAFGGHALPDHVTIGADGGIYLLDRAAGLVKRFDPCACRFETLPCFGGLGHQLGHQPRQFSEPSAIAIACGNLHVADSGNHRVAVIALRGLALRRPWTLPAKANAAQPWTPTDIAFDGTGRAYVSDPANGVIHRFTATGRWLGSWTGLGAVTSLVIDTQNRVFATVSGTSTILGFTADGKPLPGPLVLDAIAGAFPPLPFKVDISGAIELGSLCQPPCTGPLWFGADGMPTAAPTGGAVYAKTGRFMTQALDSKIELCPWHRLLVAAEIPPSTRLRLSTYTAEVDQPIEMIQALPEDSWLTRQVMTSNHRGAFDPLIRSAAGRYLWLRLDLEGGGAQTPRIRTVCLEFPRISLQRYLPAVFAGEPVSSDFTDRFLALFDTTLRGIETIIDRQAALFDPKSAPAKPIGSSGPDFLSWLGSWLGLTLNRNWPVERRRRLVANAAKLFKRRGTREGLRDLLLLLLGWDNRSHCPPPCKRYDCLPDPKPTWQPPRLILEHYALRRWLFLGAGRLGDQARLWGDSIVGRSRLDGNAQAGVTRLDTVRDPLRDPFHVHAHRFAVFVPAWVKNCDDTRRALERLIAEESPAHTVSDIHYVAPRFRVGLQSMIGYDSVIGRYPEGVTLDAMKLGRGTVLSGESHGGPDLRIGAEARIGSTTRLT